MTAVDPSNSGKGHALGWAWRRPSWGARSEPCDLAGVGGALVRWCDVRTRSALSVARCYLHGLMPAPAEVPLISKFTVLLDPDAATDFDQLALDIRRLLGLLGLQGRPGMSPHRTGCRRPHAPRPTVPQAPRPAHDMMTPITAPIPKNPTLEISSYPVGSHVRRPSVTAPSSVEREAVVRTGARPLPQCVETLHYGVEVVSQGS